MASAVLDQATPKVRLLGLDVFIVDDHAGGAVNVQIFCYGASATPPLSVDNAIHSEASRLLNVTDDTVANCKSYQVAANEVPSSAEIAIPSTSPQTIAVGLAHTAPRGGGGAASAAMFVFNPVHGNWTEARPHSPTNPEPHKVYGTLTEHFQRIIGGMIVTPEALQDQPAAIGPSALSDPLDQVNPATGMLAIDGVEPDSTGGYGIKLPMLLRPSRGPGPSFSVEYSATGAHGVLGRGWDLRVSKIELRGTSAIYHPDYETEDYTLDGMDLIALDGQGYDVTPIYKGGPILPRVTTMRQFHLRDHSGGLIIRRFGNSPNDYYWEVWDPNSHVTRLYGVDLTPDADRPPPNLNQNGVLRGQVPLGDGRMHPVIGAWGLTHEYDNQPARNGASYEYEGDACLARSRGLDCVADLRLKYVRYNLAFAATAGMPESGVTQVEFHWVERDVNRLTTDGRAGFLRAQEYWLDDISVYYRADRALPPASQEVEALQQDGKLPPMPAGMTLYANHHFVRDETNRCLNFDTVLTKYSVRANPDYDEPGNIPGGTTIAEQEFAFTYDGQRLNPDCRPQWTLPSAPLSLPAAAKADGALGFPTQLLNDLQLGLLGDDSLLGSSQTNETGASLYAGIGPADDTSRKPISGGVKAGVDFTVSEGSSTLVDVTGDGLPDFVYGKGNGLHYCRAARGTVPPHAISYSYCGEIEGISEFAHSSSSSRSIGVEGFVPGGFAGVGFNRAQTDTEVYFADRDGDGLVDLAAYGQVFYGQGEAAPGPNSGVVRFKARSALLPPVPGSDGALQADSSQPAAAFVASRQVAPLGLPTGSDEEMRRTIVAIEARLAEMSQALDQLDYSQTTLAWEAPLAGTVVITSILTDGEFVVETDSGEDGDETEIETGDAGPYGEHFTPSDFATLYTDTAAYRERYLDRRYACELWPEDSHCHQEISSPFDPHYAAAQPEYDFIKVPDRSNQIALSRADGSVTPICAGQGPCVVDVEPGEAVYLTYNVHPHLRRFVEPQVTIEYIAIPSDEVFTRLKAGDQNLADALPCLWAGPLSGAMPCALSAFSPYVFHLNAGAITTNPTASATLPPATDRVIEAVFEIPAVLTRDYRVTFEVRGVDIAPPAAGEAINPMLPAELPLMFDYEVPACSGTAETCPVEIAFCSSATSALPRCQAFANLNVDPPAKRVSAYVLATRLKVEHRLTGVQLPVRHVDELLSGLTWRVPPRVSSRPMVGFQSRREEGREPEPGQFYQHPTAASQPATLTYLPMTVGTPDTEYVRAQSGSYDNPDIDMNPGVPDAEVTDLARMMELELQTLQLAEVRQTIALCGFMDEIIEFLDTHHSPTGPPYADDYSGYWHDQRAKFDGRCKRVDAEFEGKSFTATPDPLKAGKDTLELATLLAALPYEQQITSAETLLERVLVNMSLPQTLLLDEPRLTRRGYRLPAKANPLDCPDIGKKELDAPLFGPPNEPCSYRLVTNFAMQDFDDVLSEEQADNLRELLAQFQTSQQRAFRIELTATVNGEPVLFSRLSGASSANQPCDIVPANQTCLATYGTIGPEAYFYPEGEVVTDKDAPPQVVAAEPDSATMEGQPELLEGVIGYEGNGDVFQRISANKRTARAVAFQNSIMGADARCPMDYPSFGNNLADMEFKQDCLLIDGIDENNKFSGAGQYVVSYGIGENNQFIGRNWVLEFTAKPLDILELHYRLVPETQIVTATGATPGALRGHFSVLNGSDAPGLASEQFVIPRSPWQIMFGGTADLSCPEVPDEGAPVQKRNLPKTCRPWTQLAWTEVYLGAQYRTYSDAQATGKADEFSILRRRDLLRLEPEIAVDADRFHLEEADSVQEDDKDFLTTASIMAQQKSVIPVLDDAPAFELSHQLAYFTRQPFVPKTGGNWALFAGKAGASGELVLPPAFHALRLRVEAEPQLKDARTVAQAKAACLTGDAADHQACEDHFGPADTAIFAQRADWFALRHQFIGPSVIGDLTTAAADGICTNEIVTSTASCWRGSDDTVVLESAIIAQTSPVAESARAVPSPLRSVSSLLGPERPLVVAFEHEFCTYDRVTRRDIPARPSDLSRIRCGEIEQANDEEGVDERDADKGPDDGEPTLAAEAAYPNRPKAPPQTIQLHAPILSSTVTSVSQNAGALGFNAHITDAKRVVTSTLQDINGDGYPDIISGDTAQLSSPVGLSRSDWWQYFRGPEAIPALQSELAAGNMRTSGHTMSNGQGFGLSPSTFAAFTRPTGSSGSPDAGLNPSFSLDRETGADVAFVELIDINGDGMADRVVGAAGANDGAPDGALSLYLNSGARFQGNPVNAFERVDGSIRGFHTTHGSGFGIRLGYVADDGSWGGGMGLAARETGGDGTLMDFTNDGRPDLVVPIDDGFNVYVNLGNGFSAQPVQHRLESGDFGHTASKSTLVDAGGFYTVGQAIYFVKVVFSVGAKWARAHQRELMSLRDMNGDGVPDLASTTGDGPAAEASTKIYYNTAATNHLLATITNPSGSSIALRHELLGNTGAEHGNPVWVLSGVSRYDGFDADAITGLPSDGQDVLYVEYDYARGYYNRAERQFYGFAERQSTFFGCQGSAAPLLAPARCLPLQRVDETFANTDFLTRGTLLKQSISGWPSSWASVPESPPDPQTISVANFSYSIDNASIQESWTPALYVERGSATQDPWNGAKPGADQYLLPVFGPGGDASYCGAAQGIDLCRGILSDRLWNVWSSKDTTDFWDLQSGSPRLRLVTMEVFSGTTGGDSLKSAVAFDHDPWGQMTRYADLGEIAAGWKPVESASTYANVTYSTLQGPRDQLPVTSHAPATGGYPLLGLAKRMAVFQGPWSEYNGPLLRVREAAYRADGTANLSYLCLFSAGLPKVEACKDFYDQLRKTAEDGHSTMQTAVRQAYDAAGAAPGSIILHQFVDYDEFGNLTHAISPLADNNDWIEQRFAFSADPFRMTATSTMLTRCVNEVAGAGADSPYLPVQTGPRCSFGLGQASLPQPIRRAAISHASFQVIDSHFGVVARTSDINANSLLYGHDRWGRLQLVARSWGAAPRENLTFADALDLAAQKVGTAVQSQPGLPDIDSWRLLALVGYGLKRVDEQGQMDPDDQPAVAQVLVSTLRRFEASDAYAGLLGGSATTRETTSFADGTGRPIQAIRDADVCVEASNDLFATVPANVEAAAGLAERCDETATGVVVPSTAIDALGRDLMTYEPWPAADPQARIGSAIRFDGQLWPAPAAQQLYLTRTAYDAAGRPILSEPRKVMDGAVSPLPGSTQFAYTVLPETETVGGRFETAVLSPRCSLSVMWSDARGLTRTALEDQGLPGSADGDQDGYYGVNADRPAATLAQGDPYARDYGLTDVCQPMADVIADWAALRTNLPETIGKTDYTYDPLRQLTKVDYPLTETDRAQIAVGFDMLGRTIEINDPDSGCTSYRYDGLNMLLSQSGYAYEGGDDAGACGTQSPFANVKSYDYAGGRLLQMTYQSFEEQGGPADVADSVRFYFDRYPFATEQGEILEAPRFVPNDEANARLMAMTGRNCVNCVGQVTMVSDRTGARSFGYDELGLVTRELRSIVAPVTEVAHSAGLSETYQPEIAFYEQENSYTAFGDPLVQEFSESAPFNPARTCVEVGVETCLARFSVGWKYAPDGATAQLLFNGKPMVQAAQDALGRPAIRWTADGTATGYRYDEKDLRLNQMTTLIAGSSMPAVPAGPPVQVNGYQYDGAGNVLGYGNQAVHLANGAMQPGSYTSAFTFAYDAVNRLEQFDTIIGKPAELGGAGSLSSAGEYGYDVGHRFISRSLEITGTPGETFTRKWTYAYGGTPSPENPTPSLRPPAHAPTSIAFGISGATPRTTALAYDDVGRMTTALTQQSTTAAPGVLSDRAMTWDAEGRLIRVRGLTDGAVAGNADWMREDYVYDFGGNRTLKLVESRPRPAGTAEPEGNGKDAWSESALIYMTPFYARPYDGSGTVQLAAGTLPAASMPAPANSGESPVATYLYSDLAVGSMTAAVTAYGEPGDAAATLIARREYEPFGLELTNDSLAAMCPENLAGACRNGVPPLSVFHGKELDLMTGFSSFGARSYSRDLGIWLSPDPLALSSLAVPWPMPTARMNSFGFASQNPAGRLDQDGRIDVAIAIGPRHVGAFEGRMARLGFGVTKTVTTGDAFISTLADVSSKTRPIGRLAVASHSAGSAVYMDQNSGLYTDTFDQTFEMLRSRRILPETGAATIADLRAKVADGSIVFADDAVISLLGCNTSSHLPLFESFAQALSKAVPNAFVVGATGKTTPDIVSLGGRLVDSNTYNSTSGEWVVWQAGKRVKILEGKYSPARPLPLPKAGLP